MLVSAITNTYDFRLEFLNSSRAEQFSLLALDALFEYLDELSDAIGEDIKVDVIGICCEWSEYDSVEECCAAYGSDYNDLYDLQDVTAAIPLENGGVLVHEF